MYSCLRHITSHPELHDPQACQQAAHRGLNNMSAANKSSLSELLLSFFVMYAAACEEWLCASNMGFRWAAVPAAMQLSCVACSFRCWSVQMTCSAC